MPVIYVDFLCKVKAVSYEGVSMFFVHVII